MSELRAVTIFLLLLAVFFPNVLSQYQAGDTVTCYTASGCSGSGVTTTAINCCNSTQGGGPYMIYQGSCRACVVIGFNASSLSFGPNNAGNRTALTVDVLSNPTSTSVGGPVEVTVVPDGVPNNINNYLSRGGTRIDLTSLPGLVPIRVATEGNQIALSPTAQFTYTLTVGVFSLHSSNVVLVFTNATVTIEDIDTISIVLEIGNEPPPAEGGTVTATIRRDTISPETAFTVSVSPEPYTGRFLGLSPDEKVADSSDVNFTEVKSVTFERATGVVRQTLSFPLPKDSIVELTEVFQLRVTVNDSRVRVNNEGNVAVVRFANSDVFNIGFKETDFTIPEGESQKLVIVEKDGIRGGESIGGYPESRFLPAVISSVPPPNNAATIDTDFTLNETVPNFFYTSGNLLNNTPFYPIETFEDDFIEGDEVIQIKLGVADNSAVFQIKEEAFQTATVTIRDTTVGNLTLSAVTYNVIENEGRVNICAIITGGVLSSRLRVEAVLSPDTAKFGSDYRAVTPRFFTFEAGQNETCVYVPIIDDTIREPLYEQFTFSLGRTDRPSLINLNIDRSPSVIVIQDDDRAVVSFERANYTFSEGGGNQSINVILSGGQLSKSQTVEVYIDDGSVNGFSLGNVTFAAGVAPPQTLNVTFPVQDDTIALERNELFTLKLRVFDVLEKGSPSSTNITLVDDDTVIVSFNRSSYAYTENQGTVNDVVIQLSNSIAQDLTVGVLGGQTIQPSTVEKSIPSIIRNVVFSAFGRTSSPFPITLINDNIALETNETDILAFSGDSFRGRGVQLGPNATLVVDDEDVVSVRFQQRTYLFVESDPSPLVLLQLDRPIAQELNVAVFGEPGNQPSSVIVSGKQVSEFVTFRPRSSLTSRIQNFTFINDATALETDEEFPLELIDHSFPDDDKVNLGNPTNITIRDDDIVGVTFGQSSYSFRENASNVSGMTVQLNTSIAQDLSLTIFGRPRPQASVVISGPSIRDRITFRAGGTLSEPLGPYPLTDDRVALENNEQYSVGLSNPSITQNVAVGGSTGITVIDNDVVTVSFGQPSYTFTEDQGPGNVTITLSNPIAQRLTVGFRADPYAPSNPSVVISGDNVTENIDFLPSGPTSRQVTLLFTDDTVALERVENYFGNLTGSSIANGVVLGSPTRLSVNDDDVVGVSFSQSQYTYLEDQGTISDIVARLNTSIAQDLTLRAFAESVNQPSTVEVSGFTVNTTIQFTAGGSLNTSLGSFTIRNDQVGLETQETYSLSFVRGSANRGGVVLGSNSGIAINDDDVVAVSFARRSYSYAEDSGAIDDITVQLDRAIAQDLTVSVNGAPGTQPVTVIVSGPSISQSLTFTARGATSALLNSYPITNDTYALETVEEYPLRFTGSTPSQRVTLGTNTTINIVDDDVLTVSFGSPSYTVTEGDRDNELTVVLSNPIVQPFTVTINGTSGPQTGVRNNGPTIQQTISFVPRGHLSVPFTFNVSDDSLALENLERYQVGLSNPSQQVNLGSPTEIRVQDNEVLTVSFDERMYNFLENAGLTRQVLVKLSNEVTRPVTVRVFGEPGVVPPSVTDSGSLVNQTITFASYNASTANLQRIVPVLIINDNVSGESVQSYQLDFVSLPSDVSKGQQYPNTTINIIDDDEAVVRMSDPTLTVLESSRGANIRVVLTGAISKNVSVDVINSTGGLVGRVTFSPRTGVTEQFVNVFVPYPDDSIALEPDELYRYSLSNASDDLRIGVPNVTVHTLRDDDPLKVRFGQSLYTFNETDGRVFIEIKIENQIASNFTVSTRKAVTNQEAVNPSGPSFLPDGGSVRFTPTSSRVVRVYGNITDDNSALENVERYFVMFTSPNPSPNRNPYIDIGPLTTINIVSNDIVRVTFGSGNNFNESQSDSTESIPVYISNPILQQLDVNVSSVYQRDPAVQQSGRTFTTTVSFPRGPATSRSFSFPISADNVAQENVEREVLSFTGSSPSNGVNLGPNEIATIIDLDVVTVSFVRSSITVFENETLVNVELIINSPIKQNVTVRVTGGPDTSQQNIRSSGSAVDESVKFIADGSRRVSFTFPLNDDTVALEAIETYLLNLISSTPSEGVNLGGPLRINIRDNDNVRVDFARALYTFSETDPTATITVGLSNVIALPFRISTARILTSQVNVSPSGPNFIDTIVFQTNTSTPPSVAITRAITNDDIALEDVEEYMVAFRNPMPSNNPAITVGPSTTVRVTSEDVVNVTFGTDNDFDELQSDRTELIPVLISAPIIRDLVVNISSTYQPDPLVAQSGRTYTTSVTFSRNQSGARSFNFPISADNVAQENVEREVLSFTGSSPSNGVNLGPNEIATIIDLDVVTVSFVRSSITVFENDTRVNVELMINSPIKQNVTVRVTGGPDTSQQNIRSSGSAVDESIQFIADGSMRESFTFSLNDDTVALEAIETYLLNLTSSTPSERVNLGGPLRINIRDNDILNVIFTDARNIENVPTYTFIESDRNASVSVAIDKEIARDFSIQVRGGPGSQPSTVVPSGPDTSSTITFRPSSTRTMRVPLNLTDDTVALEDNERYRLSLTNPSTTANVQVGPSARITIQDDDQLRFGFMPSNAVYNENDGTQTVTFFVSPSAKPTSYTFGISKTLSPNTTQSQFGNVNCNQNSSGILTVPSLTTSMTRITCTINITDDKVAGEDDEVVTFTPMLVNPTGVPSSSTPLTVTVLDDDVVQVSVVSTTVITNEGSNVTICVRSNGTSTQPILVVLNVSDGTAISPSDYRRSGLQSLIIPARSIGPVCTTISTVNDTSIEGNETFTGTIIQVVSPPQPNTTRPHPPVIGPDRTTTVTIVDQSPDSRTCTISSNGMIQTFGRQSDFFYNKSCEHSVVTQRIPAFNIDFSLVVDSLDGTYMTTRVGLRFGKEELVVNAFNRTVIKERNLANITYTRSGSMLDISLPILRLDININSNRIEIRVGEGSLLDAHSGLCGNKNGNLVFRNGSQVDTTDSNSMNRGIAQFLTPPSETFVRTVARRQCGLLGEDVETGDPMFAVPLYTPGLSRPHTYSLCYEIHGSANDNYNFISDGCTSVNGHYFRTADPDPDATRPFHGVDRVYIRAVDKNSKCVDITVALNHSSNLCTTRIGSTNTMFYEQNGVRVSVQGNTTIVSVPNCADGDLVMTVHCNATSTGIGYQEFRVVRGLNLNEESHGIIGQFWNIETTVTKYNETLRDGSIHPEAYLVVLKPRNKPQRSFIGFLEPTTWDFTPQPCIYAGNSQGGAIFETRDGEPNDSLLEGDFTKYKMDSSFDVTYDYSHFEQSRCT